MRRVEITYRYDDKNARVRPRPSNTDDALFRLNDGNRTFAKLLNSVMRVAVRYGGSSRLTRGTLGFRGVQVPLRNAHLRRFSAAQTPVSRSNSSSTKG